MNIADAIKECIESLDDAFISLYELKEELKRLEVKVKEQSAPVRQSNRRFYAKATQPLKNAINLEDCAKSMGISRSFLGNILNGTAENVRPVYIEGLSGRTSFAEKEVAAMIEEARREREEWREKKGYESKGV